MEARIILELDEGLVMVARLQNMKVECNNANDVFRSIDLPLISIIIPTMYRPAGLEKAFLSAASQSIIGYNIEIIVADNSPDLSAKEQTRNLFKLTGLKTYYISVPEPGVANVRNAALSVASGRFIAFLDDDQEAAPDWLSFMVSQCRRDKTSAVFSQIVSRSKVKDKNFLSKLDFFSRLHNNKPSGLTGKFYGCGASLVDLSLIDPTLIEFDTARNQTGGEDDAFFSAIQKNGGTFSWSKEAVVYEDIPKNRMSKHYICLRSFAYGQGPSRLSLELENRSISELLKWMAIGAAQFVVYAPIALISWPFENAFHMKYLRKTCEGAGKFFWQEVFRPKLYGQAAADKILKKQNKLKSAENHLAH